jgi:hypothetical protein
MVFENLSRPQSQQGNYRRSHSWGWRFRGDSSVEDIAIVPQCPYHRIMDLGD